MRAVMKVSMIWAMSRNRVIGRNNDLPWRLPRDMKHFMTTTRGHPVIMGRRTFESMDRRPLPGRMNIVVTGNPDYQAPGATVVGDLDAALAEARRCCEQSGVDEVFITGGAGLYRPGLEVADRLYVTEIDAQLQGDTFFPDVDWSRWRRVSSERFPADAAHAYSFTISLFERAERT
jgi:dihydrofolate reductase